MYQYTMKQATQEKHGSQWKTVEVETREVSQQFYNNVFDVNGLKFMRRLGGSETVQKAYTCKGYIPIRLLSTNPSRNIRIIREFSVKWVD